MLVDIASKGGNLLLNVGPTEEGLIPRPSVERLEAIGEWMAVNGESIYGTDASPFFKLPWGRCTQKRTGKGTTLYLHVFHWPEDGILRVPGINTRVKGISLLSDRSQKLSSKKDGDDLLIELPADSPDPVNTVVVMETRGSLEVTSNMPSVKEGKIVLPADFADIHNPGYGTHIMLKGSGEEALFTRWVDPRARVEWMFHNEEPGNYILQVAIKASASSKLIIQVGEEEMEVEILSTGGELKEIRMGEIYLPETGDLILSMRPVREEWNGIELGKTELIQQ
jgi:alpha-L-fucosidase